MKEETEQRVLICNHNLKKLNTDIIDIGVMYQIDLLVTIQGGDTNIKSTNNWESLPLMFDSRTTAILLGVQSTTITKWARHGQIPCKKIGRRYFFEKEAIKNFIKNGGQK